MKITLVDSPKQLIRLLPFTFNKSIADLWLGTSSIKELYKRVFGSGAAVLTNDKLQELYPEKNTGNQLFVVSHLVPTDEMLMKLKELKKGQEYRFEGVRVAYVGLLFSDQPEDVIELKTCDFIKFPWDLVLWNSKFIKVNADHSGWQGDLDKALSVSGDVHVHEDAEVQACFIDGRRGPVIIDEEAIICNGANLVGPVYVGKGAVVLGNAYIRNGVTLADDATVGGEVKNSVFLPGATKSHEGTVGDSYLGSYSNLGAGTTVSNLKNTYGTIASVDHLSGEIVDTGLQKLGVFLGDYVHTIILTQFQSGTSVGFGTHVLGRSEKVVGPLRWGESPYDSDRFLEVIQRHAALKGIGLSQKRVSFIRSLLSDFFL